MDEDDNQQGEIEEHVEIMMRAGVSVIGPPVLIPEGAAYPGAYQVWIPAYVAADHVGPVWVYVNPEGVMVYADQLPNAEDMRERA